MVLIPRNLDYTDRDFESMRSRAFSLISRLFPDWTDDSVANFGNLLVELYCFVGDNLSYYQDKQARESRLTDATQRQNILKIAKMLGYTPKGASAATTVVTLTLNSVPTSDVVFPSDFRIRTADITDAVEFRLALPATIPAGTDPPQVIAEVVNSSLAEDVFISNDAAGQSFTLLSSPFVDNTEVVSASGVAYSRVASLYTSSSTDNHYVLSVDNKDRAVITFGNGVSGTIPSGEIVVSYEIGGGSAGNVEVGTLTRPNPSTITDKLGNSYSLSSNNATKASGGLDRESEAKIREAAPLSARLTTRTVALEDYVLGAQEVPGIARALMATSDQAAGIPENNGRLYVVPTGGGPVTALLKQQVLEAVTITRPHTITFKVTVFDPVYLLVNIYARVYLKPGYTEAVVRGNIESALEELFAISNEDGTVNDRIKFGLEYKSDVNDTAEIPLSDIINAVIDAPGVRKLGDLPSDITANALHRDVSIGDFDFPVLGTISLRNGDTGNLF